MKSTFLILLFSLLAQLNLSAQNEYSTFIAKAKIHANKNEHDQSLKLHLKAFEYARPLTFDCMFALKESIQLKNDSVTNELALLCSSIGCTNSQLDKIDFGAFKNSNYWERYLEKRDSINIEYDKNLDHEWITDIGKMEFMDQQIRGVFMSSFNDSAKREEAIIAMSVIDSLNFNYLVKKTKEKGFPTPITVGQRWFDNAFLILWHHRGSEFYENPLWIEIKPYIEKEINAGNIPKSFFAMFEDHYRIMNEKPMLYGSLYGYYRNSEEYNTLTVYDQPNLNKRRKEIGLCTLELWLESLELQIPKSLYPK